MSPEIDRRIKDEHSQAEIEVSLRVKCEDFETEWLKWIGKSD